MQVLLNLLAITVMILAIKHTHHSGKVIAGILSFFWLWMGIAYHLTYFTAINKAAYAFGALFILQGGLFLLAGVFKGNLSFRYQPMRVALPESC